MLWAVHVVQYPYDSSGPITAMLQWPVYNAVGPNYMIMQQIVTHVVHAVEPSCCSVPAVEECLAATIIDTLMLYTRCMHVRCSWHADHFASP